MKRGNSGETSQTYRKANSDRFESLGDGRWGGYKAGVANGPAPRTDRGRKRTKVKW
jgi:hypothetical protein